MIHDMEVQVEVERALADDRVRAAEAKYVAPVRRAVRWGWLALIGMTIPTVVCFVLGYMKAVWVGAIGISMVGVAFSWMVGRTLRRATSGG